MEYCKECDEKLILYLNKKKTYENYDIIIKYHTKSIINMIIHDFNRVCKRIIKNNKLIICNKKIDLIIENILLDFLLNYIIDNNIDCINYDRFLKFIEKYKNYNYTKIWKGIDYYFLKIFGKPYILRDINIDKETYKKKELLNLQFKHNVFFDNIIF